MALVANTTRPILAVTLRQLKRCVDDTSRSQLNQSRPGVHLFNLIHPDYQLMFK